MFDVYVNGVFQGRYIALSVNSAISQYCAEYKTSRNDCAKRFGDIPQAFPAV